MRRPGPSSRVTRSAPFFRRSRHVVSFWQDGRLVVLNYVTGVAVPATSLVLDILDALDEWRTWADLSAGRSKEEQRLLRRLVELMVQRTLVSTSDAGTNVVEGRLRKWDSWNPAAGFFHLSTKNVPFRAAHSDQLAVSCERSAVDPVPPPLKHDDAPGMPLPAVSATGDLSAALLARRTWRNFGQRPLPLDALATLLQLTWGVQGWIEIPGVGRFALKTSPSGGARHSIEVYVLARKIDGLRRGLYHYKPDTHRLARAGRHAPRRITDYLPGQDWYNDASAVMLMTAVFERVQWRYPYARAYRAILAESGHLCQTFCLLATALGLAPFCTMALADSRIERDLQLDGVSESVIYAAGVGARPAGVDWSPWPGTDGTPLLSPPAHRTRARR